MILLIFAIHNIGNSCLLVQIVCTIDMHYIMYLSLPFACFYKNNGVHIYPESIITVTAQNDSAICTNKPGYYQLNWIEK